MFITFAVAIDKRKHNLLVVLMSQRAIFVSPHHTYIA